jgi:hypothetical protein
MRALYKKGMPMPLPPGHRKVIHYFGYVYPVIFIGLGAAGLMGLLSGVLGRTPEGKIILGLLSVAGISLGGFLAWRHSKEDAATPIPTLDDYPLREQARQIRAAMRLIAIVTVLFGGYTAYQVMQVEYGWTRSARVWEPVASVYNAYGFLPALLCVPLLGLLILLVLAWKLRSTREGMAAKQR